jgi:hypothetical protein
MWRILKGMVIVMPLLSKWNQCYPPENQSNHIWRKMNIKPNACNDILKPPDQGLFQVGHQVEYKTASYISSSRTKYNHWKRTWFLEYELEKSKERHKTSSSPVILDKSPVFHGRVYPAHRMLSSQAMWHGTPILIEQPASPNEHHNHQLIPQIDTDSKSRWYIW